MGGDYDFTDTDRDTRAYRCARNALLCIAIAGAIAVGAVLWGSA